MAGRGKSEGRRETNRPKLVDRILGDENLRSAIWFAAAAFLVFYLGAMLVLRLVLIGGESSHYDGIVIAVIGAIVAVVAGRKKYNDDI